MDLMDDVYERIYKEETLGLQRRLQSEPNLSPEDIEGMLKTFYEFDGQDLLGRGEIQSVNIAATIAAYEDFLQLLKNKN
jgi:hypothetical protein